MVTFDTNFPSIARDILRQLIEAEQKKKPLTLAQANEKWHHSSTWEDLVESGFITRNSETVTVTSAGREWYDSE